MANVKLKVNKKTTIILLVVLFLVIGGTGGYLLWRVNQQDTVAPTDSSAGPVTCEKGADCPACIWPKVGWCRKGADGKWTCGCEYCNNRTPGEGPYCLDTEPKCHPTENCPSGYNEFVVNPNCENMVSNGEAEIQRMLESRNVPNSKECTEGGQVCYRECSTACDGCNNKYIYRIYCVKEDSPPDEPPVEEPEPFCGDGNLDPGEECDPKNNTVKCPLGECTSKCLCPCDGVGK